MKKLLFILTTVLFFFGCQGKQETQENSQPETKLDTQIQTVNADVNGLQITNAWVRPAAENKNTAIFFDIVNDTEEDVVIIGAQSDLAEKTEVHETFKKNGDMMGMRKVDSVVVKNGETFRFKPMAHHVMLINLNEDLTEGKEVEFTLQFKYRDEIKVKSPVKENIQTMRAAEEKKMQM